MLDVCVVTLLYDSFKQTFLFHRHHSDLELLLRTSTFVAHPAVIQPSPQDYYIQYYLYPAKYYLLVGSTTVSCYYLLLCIFIYILSTYRSNDSDLFRVIFSSQEAPRGNKAWRWRCASASPGNCLTFYLFAPTRAARAFSAARAPNYIHSERTPPARE